MQSESLLRNEFGGEYINEDDESAHCMVARGHSMAMAAAAEAAAAAHAAQAAAEAIEQLNCDPSVSY